MVQVECRGKRLWWWVGLLIWTWLFPSLSIGQERTEGLQALSARSTGARMEWKARTRRMSSVLLSVHDRMAHQLAAVQAEASFDYTALSNPLVQVDAAGRVQVYISVDRLGEAEQDALRAQGVEIEIANTDFDMVQGWVLIDQLESVAALDFVHRITAPDYAVTRRGSVTTAGDTVLNANRLRDIGFDGTGVKVGVISDGADNRDEAIASGDLPADITVFGSCVRGGSFTCNEGTAMLEIIHDLAPGAELGIGALNLLSRGTSMDFINRLTALRTTFGADIIVDDLGFFGEPFFEDGMVAQAVQEAVDNGIIYASSAGNGAETHYEAEFVPATSQSLPVHDFGLAAGQGSDTTLNVVIGSRGTLIVSLQWSDAFGSSGNDYDLLILDESEQTTLASSEDQQDGNDNPSEIASYVNPENTLVRVKLVIEQARGEGRRLELFVLGSAVLDEYIVPDGSVVGHAAVPGVLAAGAIDARIPGADQIEPYSARGPALIVHPVPEMRPKPDIVAVDGVEVTGAGGFSTRFFGTSASAPHVAGVAALLQSAGTLATAAEIRDAITASAVDLGSPGLDMTYGAGRVDAVAALSEFDNVPPNGQIDTPLGDVTITPGATLTFAASGTDFNGDTPLTYRWNFGGAAPDSTRQDPGAVTFNNPGLYTISLTTTDSRGLSDATPATRLITVELSDPRRDGGGSGGGCALSPGAPADGVFLSAIGVVFGLLGWRRLRRPPLGA